MLTFLNFQQPIFETGNQFRDVLKTLKTQTSMLVPFFKNSERLKTDNSFPKKGFIIDVWPDLKSLIMQ